MLCAIRIIFSFFYSLMCLINNLLASILLRAENLLMFIYLFLDDKENWDVMASFCVDRFFARHLYILLMGNWFFLFPSPSYPYDINIRIKYLLTKLTQSINCYPLSMTYEISEYEIDDSYEWGKPVCFVSLNRQF